MNTHAFGCRTPTAISRDYITMRCMQSSAFGTRGTRCRPTVRGKRPSCPDSHAEMKSGTQARTIARPRAAVAARRP
ncbi:hypothetical protein CN645_19165 [Burkholderia sp. IDO3]|nr:hypothetical protein DCN14_04175 [Burkholderia sp. IDO3]PCD60227.1 hypothetical protein CN645_19165 [Burkholderia sp. IDO3]